MVALRCSVSSTRYCIRSARPKTSKSTVISSRSKTCTENDAARNGQAALWDVYTVIISSHGRGILKRWAAMMRCAWGWAICIGSHTCLEIWMGVLTRAGAAAAWARILQNGRLNWPVGLPQRVWEGPSGAGLSFFGHHWRGAYANPCQCLEPLAAFLFSSDLSQRGRSPS